MDSLQELIDAREITLNCNACGHASQKPIAWVRSHREMLCQRCGAVVILGTSQLKARIRELERQMRELHRLLLSQIKR